MSESTKNNESKKGHRLFSDISVVQVVATALAAVTSMFLASYIGFLGSLIGAGVASIISTLAASLYKKILADSTEKIKELPGTVKKKGLIARFLSGKRKASGDSHAEGDVKPSHEGPVAPSIPKDEEAADINAQVIALASSDWVQAAPIEDTAVAIKKSDHPASDKSDESSQPDLSDKRNTKLPEQVEGSAGAAQEDAAKRESDTVHKIKEEEERQRHRTRNLIIVCVVSALIAVAASAAVIYLATTGEGIGAKPKPITEVLQRVESGDSGDSSQAGSDQNATSNSSDSDDQDNSGTDAANNPNTASNNTADNAKNTANNTTNSNTSANTNTGQNANTGSNANTGANSNTSGNASAASGNTSSSSNASSGSNAGTGTSSGS